MTGESRDNFLYGTPNTAKRAGGLEQMTVKTVTGAEWTCRMLVKSLADMAVDRAEWLKDAGSWGEWDEITDTEKEEEQESKRSVQVERWL